MNNFFEKAFALRNRYYDNAVKKSLERYGSLCEKDTNPRMNCDEIEILSQLVATYLMYGGYFPTTFSIILAKHYYKDYMLSILQSIFYDLSIEYEVESVYCSSGRFTSTYTYEIILSK